jgi:DNA repair exonuclease SbcCD ATPase subunit
MKEIRIEKLAIENFKGIKELTVEFSGATTNIYGDNATGKTSIFDAYLWLLFGKDSQGRADFEAKPLDKDGEPIHGVETKVEGTFSVDGKPLVLSLSFSRRFTRRSGPKREDRQSPCSLVTPPSISWMVFL